jgi:catecholate siderophore receptor
MGVSRTMSGSGLRAGLIASVAVASAGAAHGQEGPQPPAEQQTDVVIVEGYQVDTLSSPKYTQPVLDTPQTVTMIADTLLEEQGRRTLRDSLRNITGVSIQAGEGNPPGGDSMKIRGFSARDDIFVDGLADNGNYYRDPFNAERIEVTKGPASAFAGRGNVGGTINIVSRAPVMDDFQEYDIAVGTADYYRGTADINAVLSEDAGIAVRFNGLLHQAGEPGRDTVENTRIAFNPQIAFGLGGDTTATLSYYTMRQRDIPDYGLPNGRNITLAGSGFEGRVAPVSTENFYGYANDYRDIDVHMLTGVVTHRISDMASFRTQARYARVHNDSITSAPRFVGAVTTLDGTTQAVGNRKPRDQVDELLVGQADLTLTFDTGTIAHTLVTGVEISSEETENRRRLDVNGPAMNLFNPTLLTAPAIAYNGTRARVETDVASAYVFDSIEFTPQWIVNAGVRYDAVETRVQGIVDPGFTVPGYATDLSADDGEFSGNLALVFKPVPEASLYVAWGTGFETSGRADIVQVAGGNNAPPATAANFNVDPEKSQSVEIGAKWDVLESLQLSAALFQIDKTNARTPGVNPGDPPVVLDGEQQVQGFELSAVGTVVPGVNVIASYAYLDGEVSRSNNPFEQGQRLDNLPEHSASIWTSWRINSDWMVGGGVQYVGERISDVRQSPTANIQILSPEYTVLDAVVEWELSDEVQLRLNLYNLTDEEYFQSLSSAQSIPGASRAAILSLDLAY